MGIEKRKVNWRPPSVWQGIWVYWLPLIGYMVLIFYLSSQPLEGWELPDVWNIDKIFHMIEYGVLGILWLRALNERVSLRGLKWLAFIFTLLYGVSDEVHQMFVPNRSSSIFDVMADGLGGWLGVWVYSRLRP